MTAQQQSLFAGETAPWEDDDRSEVLAASVAFAEGPDQTYDYVVPDRLRATVQPGRRLRVPFGHGNRSKIGYCVAVATRQVSSRRLKAVAAVVDETPLLDPAMLRLARWIADNYLCPFGQVLETMLPAGVRGRAGTRNVLVLRLAADAREKLAEFKLTATQAEIVRYLGESLVPRPMADVLAACGCTPAPINTLRRKGLVVADTQRMLTARDEEPKAAPEQHLALNPAQQQALDAILVPLHAGRHETILLHGVTGSGKTEVYIQAIEHVLRFGRQAIVLVPEISLTPQTRQRFCARFGDVAVLHSHLSDSDRYFHWQRIARGDVRVVVGARSAIFAPTPHLGLVVLDEEHETTFKQDTSPRYHAREVALLRARAQNVPLVLGSATPSLESWHRAATGEYRLVSLPKRILDRPMPYVGTIDLRTETKERMARGAISRPLRMAMEKSLEAGGQVILFLNRRGYSTHIQCPSCGHVVRCPSCDLALTHHRQGEIALCHYCEYQTPSPTRCPACTFEGIRFSGLGTQRLEAEVQARFAGYRCLRMDADTMRRPGSHEAALEAFRAGHVRILLGTQMIAKGLDFPGVTLVGVINSDTALHLPDFRAAERTFQLIVQVAGRTGRGEKGGQVLVQSLSPDHAAIRFAVQHDYDDFARQELPIRQLLSYPPFAKLIRIVVRGAAENQVRALAEEIAKGLSAALDEEAAGSRQSAVCSEPRTSNVEHPASNIVQTDVAEVARLRASSDSRILADSATATRVLGPAPCPLPKLRGEFRYQLHVQGPDGDRLRAAVRQVTAKIQSNEELRWIVDVDPIDMM